MFNEINRDVCRLQLHSYPELKQILPYFDLLYQSPNTCWYKAAETGGKYRQFRQTKGFTQGCPMSGGGLAVLILSMILLNINEQLLTRQTTNTQSPSPHTSSSIDDTNLFLPLEDVTWFISQFEELGQPQGIKLNRQETKLLIGPNTNSTPTQQIIIKHSKNILKPSNILYDGCKVLGQAIGTSEYVNNYMHEQALKYRIYSPGPTTPIPFHDH
jgi:hypothetical protein